MWQGKLDSNANAVVLGHRSVPHRGLSGPPNGTVAPTCTARYILDRRPLSRDDVLAALCSRSFGVYYWYPKRLPQDE